MQFYHQAWSLSTVRLPLARSVIAGSTGIVWFGNNHRRLRCYSDSVTITEKILVQLGASPHLV